jgi:hypothetical protein
MRSRFKSLAVGAVAALALVLVGAATAESPNVNTPASVTGNAVVGQELTAHNGTWLYSDGSSCKSECTMSYQWQRCQPSGCSDISGAAGRFYTVQAADAGYTLRAMETMTSEDCGEWNYSTGTRECRAVSKSAPSGQTALVPGGTPTAPTAPTAPSAPTVPAAPAPQAPLLPVATAAPRVSGIAMVDETLTATRGTWSGSPTLQLQWQRCDAAGQNCADLGLAGDTYTVIAFDIGKTLRVRITALNGAGARDAVSDPTAVVSELKPTEDKPSLAAAKVIAPHRLTFGEVAARPLRLVRRTPVTVRLRVFDSRGFQISGALVSAVVLPRGALVAPAELASGDDGSVTLTFTPGPKLNLKKRGAITLIVNARRPDDRPTSPRAAVERLRIAIVPAKKR